MNVLNLLKHTPHLMGLSSKTKFTGMEDVLGGQSAQVCALDQLHVQASIAGKYDLWRWFSEWTNPCVKVHMWHLVLEKVMQPNRKAYKDGFGYSSDRMKKLHTLWSSLGTDEDPSQQCKRRDFGRLC